MDEIVLTNDDKKKKKIDITLDIIQSMLEIFTHIDHTWIKRNIYRVHGAASW